MSVPPTVSVGPLPPGFSDNQTSSGDVFDRTMSQRDTSDIDNSNMAPRSDVTTQAHTTTSRSDHANELAVAEMVPSSSFASFEEDLDHHIEGRAIDIAQQVLDDIRLRTVHAETVGDPQSLAESEVANNKKYWSIPEQKSQIHLLLRLVTALAVVILSLVIALMVVLVARTNIPHAVPVQLDRCSFCAGGVESSKSLEMLRTIPVGSSTAHFTCADLKQQRVPSNDTNCPVHQSLAFIYNCGCLTAPPKPPNATCTACPGGSVLMGSSQCNQVDAAVAIVGSASVYWRDCADFRHSWFNQNCTCPATNTNVSHVKLPHDVLVNLHPGS